jgi:lipid A 3-O-deacylase
VNLSNRLSGKLCTLALAVFSTIAAVAQATPAAENPLSAAGDHQPFEIGALAQGGFGVTEDRGGFKFFMLGGHAGKVLTGNSGPGLLRGNFEYAVEIFPFWQSYTPTVLRETCTVDNQCSAPYPVGGTYTGISITPIILRWNFATSKRITPWVQGAGGVLWTNHKYPPFGGPPYTVYNDGTTANTSVWNFTPQFGVGMHYFIKPRRSIDFGANAVHISSASLGDKNPGVNASVQFSIGYTWWK